MQAREPAYPRKEALLLLRLSSSTPTPSTAAVSLPQYARLAVPDLCRTSGVEPLPAAATAPAPASLLLGWGPPEVRRLSQNQR